MTERDKLLKEVSKYYFAKLETEMFLDTHPDNRTALKAREKYKERYDCLRNEYENRFNMLSKDAVNKSDQRWTWVDNPWPWDQED